MRRVGCKNCLWESERGKNVLGCMNTKIGSILKVASEMVAIALIVIYAKFASKGLILQQVH